MSIERKSKIFITGDTHGEIDFGKLSSKEFPIGKTLTKNDYVIYFVLYTLMVMVNAIINVWYARHFGS